MFVLPKIRIFKSQPLTGIKIWGFGGGGWLGHEEGAFMNRISALIGGRVVRNMPANAGDTRDTGFIPGLGRSPGEGNGNPPQFSCLENSRDKGTWWTTVHGSQRVR